MVLDVCVENVQPLQLEILSLRATRKHYDGGETHLRSCPQAHSSHTCTSIGFPGLFLANIVTTPNSDTNMRFLLYCAMIILLSSSTGIASRERPILSDFHVIAVDDFEMTLEGEPYIFVVARVKNLINNDAA